MKWLCLPFLFLSILSNAQYLKSGKWRGVVHYSDYEVPFSFEVGYPNGEIPQITLINGQERRIIEQVLLDGDSITIPLSPFDVAIKAKFSATSMEGSYIKYYRNNSFSFSAEFGKPRMIKTSPKKSVNVEDRWSIVFEDKSEGVGLFKQIRGAVTGTFMTKVSDYRYFEGIVDGDSIKLSCFDGAHAFMILGKKQQGEWTGKIIYDDGFNEAWTGTPDPEASLENPFEIVNLEAEEYRPYYDLLGAGSGKNAIDAEEYKGKVLIIQVFGTWCPNSHDQTKYLVDWYADNKDRNVAILASSYEANYSQEYGLRRINEYVKANQIPYEVVLGGRLSKTSAAMPFPFMQRIEAFPTLVIVDKKGYARYVHSYFNGPATGSYYEQFDERFNQIIDDLLLE